MKRKEQVANQESSDILDNDSRGRAGDFLTTYLSPSSILSVVSAYFTIHAYHALKTSLDSIAKMRFLFGDPQFVGRLDNDDKASKEYSLIEGELTLENQLQQGRLARECAAWIEQKAEIRTVRQSGLLHGKLYHIENDVSDHAMLGSSNFTVSGLGLRESNNNVELNIVVEDKVEDNRVRKDLLAWFDEWWSSDDKTKDIKEDVLMQLSKLYSNQPPQFIYYLTLFHIFREIIDAERDTDTDLSNIQLPDTRVWRSLFSFQKDGAKAAINKIRAFNGCILADSVGLGKTYTALAVIKYFELKNERVLVLCPKKLSRNWTLYRNNDTLNPLAEDRFRYDVLHHTDLSRGKGEVNGLQLETINWGAYDLVVIDESHNFRNNKSARQDAGEPPKRNRYERLMEDIIRTGSRTKVLLLSATPVNNELSDLRNQLSFIAGGDVMRNQIADRAFAQTLNVASIKSTISRAQKQFKKWANMESTNRKSQDLLKTIGGDFFNLLDGLSIARSRKQISRYYKETGGDDRVLDFPKRTTPNSLNPPIDIRKEQISFEKLDAEISALSLALYHPTQYLRKNLPKAVKSSYEDERIKGFTQYGRERILINMMKINFLKRLESSIDSFRITMQRVIDKIDDLEERFREFEAHKEQNPEIDYDILKSNSEEDDDLEENDFLVGGKRKFHLGHIDITRWREAIKKDRQQLQNLLDQAKETTPQHDGKLVKLRQLLLEKLAKPTTTKDGRLNRKTLIFTAFADTARYLYEQLRDDLVQNKAHVALVQGSGGNQSTLGNSTDFDDILTNFSPVSKRRAEQERFPQDEEIDILIATDCISEGQNLQDCDKLINYDIHWNPVRIIQRFGRIDRIGSCNESVRLVNFWPVADLDRYLKVQHRVEARMALVDLSATQTDNLLENEQLKELISKDLSFRDNQLRRMQREILDLEDFDDNITLADFSLDEFRMDLLQFLESKREELEDAHLGLYAVVPTKGEYPIAQPGVIFCLRHLGQNFETTEDRETGSGISRQINPLGNYYLVYVLDDGTVRFTFAHPKHILNLFRDLAAELPTAQERLCELFDKKTDEGNDMSDYNKLVKKMLESIAHTFSRRAVSSLFSGRDGQLPNATEIPTEHVDEYDLVTWLVIMK